MKHATHVHFGSFFHGSVNLHSGNYRVEKEGNCHIVLYDKVPLSAVEAIFLPQEYEADMKRLYNEEFDDFDNTEFKHLQSSKFECKKIVNNLKVLTPTPFYERIHYYTNALFSGMKGFVQVRSM